MYKRHINRRHHHIAAFILVSTITILIGSGPTKAGLACIPCDCVFREAAITMAIISAEHRTQRVENFGCVNPPSNAGGPPNLGSPNPECSVALPIRYGDPMEDAGSGGMRDHQHWLLFTLFKNHILRDWMMFAEQMTVVAMHQMLIIGEFYDAQNELETQRLYQRLTARAHKDYHPSVQMCSFPTLMRSLATANQNVRMNSTALNQHFLARNLGEEGHSAGPGPSEDLSENTIDISDKAGSETTGRLGRFSREYCDASDMNKAARPDTGLFFCRSKNPITGAPRRHNADIDFTRMLGLPRIVDVDFSDPNGRVARVGSDLIALQSNLYGNTVGMRADADKIQFFENRDEYLDFRSVIAKRSVAENSFNNIASLKTRGSTNELSYPGKLYSDHSSDPNLSTFEYMKIVFNHLGFDVADPEELQYYLGYPDENKEMSYYAQMEVLSKRLYQYPQFYVNLTDKPVNVRRMSVAMQAIESMLQRDIYKSYARSEVILSQLLELNVDILHENVQGRLNAARTRK